MVGKLTPDNIVSASTIPALMGFNPYQTKNDLLKQCIEATEGTYVSGFQGNEATHWGNTLEPVILAQAVNRLGLVNVEIDVDHAIFHPTLALACSLDGRGEGSGTIDTSTENGIYCVNAPHIDISGMGCLESKLTRAIPEAQPAPYRGPWQLQAQMMCTGCTWGAVCVLYQGIEMRVFVYQADAQMQDMIAGAVREFERRKEDRDWYPILTSADGNTAYSRVDEDAHDIDLSVHSEGEFFLRQLVDAKGAKAAAEAQIDEAEAALKEIMGSHEKAHGAVGNVQYSVSWPQRVFKAQPEKITPAKPARVVRQQTLTVKEM
jgi:hypothetical protein